MTSITGTPSSFVFNKSMFSDPSMRAHLKEYYEDAYEPIMERVAGMKEAEASGQALKTISLPDGRTATMFTAAQYEAMIPSFDQWLDIQQNVASIFDFVQESKCSVQHAKDYFETVEKVLGADQPSDVRTVFSDGDQILGYINKDGSLVTHEGGNALQKIAKQAEKLNLTGEAKIAYLKEYGAAELSNRYANLHVTNYDDQNMLTRREFSEKWYPDHDVDLAYKTSMKEAKEFLEQQETWYKQQLENLDNFRSALLQIMEEAQGVEQQT